MSIADNPVGCRGRQGGSFPEVYRNEVPDRVWVKGKHLCRSNTSQIHGKKTQTVNTCSKSIQIMVVVVQSREIPCMCHNVGQLECLSHQVNPGSWQEPQLCCPYSVISVNKHIFCSSYSRPTCSCVMEPTKLGFFYVVIKFNENE